MKIQKVITCLLLTGAMAAAGLFAGCGQIKDAANSAKSTVTSLADKVNNFEMDQDADTLNNAVKNFYNGVLDGTINSVTKGTYVTASLPSPDADTAARSQAVKTLTILSVLEEQGMTARYPENKMSNFVSCNGTIRYKGSVTAEDGTPVPLTYETTVAAALNQ